jgi:glycosyltransferase involved in cell wall biosynthesis
MHESENDHHEDLPMITVGIPTFNRASSLRQTLSSLRDMAVPDDLAWELVVVNNNCTDETDRVLEEFAGFIPLRSEFEPRQGHCHARNRVLEAARGDYIVWTDDDVIVDRDWLAAYARAFRRWPEVAVFGGFIRPRYEEPVASWIIKNETLLCGPLVIRDLGDKPVLLSVQERRFPYGANMAVRAREQRMFRYNPELGPGPRGRLGEEVDVVERILRSGATGYWIPDARVEHCIGRNRQTIRFVARYSAACAESAAITRNDAAGGFWLGAPRWMWRRLLEEWLRYRIHRLTSSSPIWVNDLLAWSTTWGAIRYSRNQRR